MPYSTNSPNDPCPLLMKGVPCYLLGSLNYRQDNTVMAISRVALTSDVATITVQITRGEIPIVGALLTITQTVTSTGAFNVARAVITAVSINAQTGAGTISYALTSGNVAVTADFGTAIAEVPEIPDAFVNGNSIACCAQAPQDGNAFTVVTSVLLPSAPSTLPTIVFQEAIRNVNSEFSTIGTFTGLGENGSFTLRSGSFYRFSMSGGSGGTNPTVIAKVR